MGHDRAATLLTEFKSARRNEQISTETEESNPVKIYSTSNIKRDFS